MEYEVLKPFGAVKPGEIYPKQLSVGDKFEFDDATAKSLIAEGYIKAPEKKKAAKQAASKDAPPPPPDSSGAGNKESDA